MTILKRFTRKNLIKKGNFDKNHEFNVNHDNVLIGYIYNLKTLHFWREMHSYKNEAQNQFLKVLRLTI